MLKQIILFVFVLGFCITLCSCETVKGTAKGFFTGVSKDIGNTFDNIVDAGRAIKRADEKFQEKFW